MVLIRQLNRKAVIPAVASAGIVIGHIHENHGHHFALFHGMIHHMLEGCGISVRPHQRGLVAPAAVTDVEHVVLLIIGISVRKIDPGFLGQPLSMLLIGKRFPGVIGQLLQPPLMLCGTVIALRDILQFIGDCPAQIFCFHIGSLRFCGRRFRRQLSRHFRRLFRRRFRFFAANAGFCVRDGAAACEKAEAQRRGSKGGPFALIHCYDSLSIFLSQKETARFSQPSATVPVPRPKPWERP